jgi:peptide chain release factor 1
MSVDSVEDAIRRRLAAASVRYRELVTLSQDPDIATDHVRAAPILRELGQLKSFATLDEELARVDSDLEEAEELLAEGNDAETVALAEAELEEKEARRREILDRAAGDLVSRDEYGDRNVILEIRAGTGGDEAALFAGDLFRMYSRYAERKEWKVEVLSVVGTELGGLKEVVASISGADAYQNLRFESGGHRVQRVPETEAQGRIHTSLATVAVMPEADKVEVDLKRDDLKIDFFRASGPGGQKVNKTSSAVRIVHIPTGLKVECQDEKSQHKNRSRAEKILAARLMDYHRSRAEAERSDLRRSQIGTGDRNEKIRTYNFPQNRVTDHRVHVTLYDLANVMEGELDELIEQLAQADREVKLRALAGGGAGGESS